MFNTIKVRFLSISLVLMALVSTASAQPISVAKPGSMCSWDIVVANLSCINPVEGDDVRLYIMEFQDCKHGNITNLDKSVSGHVFSEPNESYEENKVSVAYASSRIHFDDRTDDLTFLMPKSAIIQTPKSKYVLDISSQIVPNYEGADITQDWSFAGTFRKVDAKGAVLSSGRLLCSVSK